MIVAGVKCMSEIKLTAIYEKAEEGGYIGYVVELPGANTQGETLEETRETLKEAATVLLDGTATSLRPFLRKTKRYEGRVNLASRIE